MLYGVAEHRARHRRGVSVEEGSQSPAVLLARLAQPAAGGLVDQILLVVEQHLGDPEGVVHIAVPDEEVGADDGGAAFPHVLGARQLVEDLARFVGQVAADDVRAGHVDQVPVVDPVRASQVEVEQLLPAAFWRPFASGLLVHDAEAAGAHLVDRALEQLLDLVRRHLDELLGEREDLPHAHADELVALAVLSLAQLEVPPVLLALLRRTVRVQPLDEPLRVVVLWHPGPPLYRNERAFSAGVYCRTRNRRCVTPLATTNAAVIITDSTIACRILMPLPRHSSSNGHL